MQLTRADRLWLTSGFLDSVQKRARQEALTEKIVECLDHLKRNARHPGLNLEQIHTAGSYPIYSARVTQKWRLILAGLTRKEIALLHFDNHDEAYDWADRNLHRLPSLLDDLAELPAPASLKGLAAGEPLPVVQASEDGAVAIAAAEQFRAMCEGGLDRYLMVLDDHQRNLATLEQKGLLLVKGGAGSGKTAIAVQRLVHLSRRSSLSGGRVLYLCFNRSLAGVVRQLLASAFGGSVPAHVEVSSLHAWANGYLGRRGQSLAIDEERLKAWLGDAAARFDPESAPDPLRSGDFLYEEIRQVIKANGLRDEDAYLQIERIGRGSPLKQSGRRTVWRVYEELRQWQAAEGVYQFEDLPALALDALRSDPGFTPYEAIVLDEAQDLSAVAIRLALAAAGSGERLFVLADTAQSIYENGFAWAQRELDVKGGQVVYLRDNYRNTRQIHALAAALLSAEEDPQVLRDLQQSHPPKREGPLPALVMYLSGKSEDEGTGAMVQAEVASRPPGHVAVLVPSRQRAARVLEVLGDLSLPAEAQDENGRIDVSSDAVKVLPIPSAKGLDFPAVFVIGLAKGSLGGAGLADRPKTRREVYTALTRASEKLVISAVVGYQHPLVDRLPLDLVSLEGEGADDYRRLRGRLGT
jgi:superfamily I DNA/RNA helicase